MKGKMIMKFKKKKILSTFGGKNYYDIVYDNDENLIIIVNNIIKLFNEKHLYFSYYSENSLDKNLNHLRKFKIKNKIVYELKDYNLLSLLINNKTINKIRNLDIYFFENPIMEERIDRNYLHNSDFQIYFENY